MSEAPGDRAGVAVADGPGISAASGAFEGPERVDGGEAAVAEVAEVAAAAAAAAVKEGVQALRDGTWTVPKEMKGRPLDGVVRALLGVTWAEARRLVASGKILVGEAVITDARRLTAAGAKVSLRLRAPRPETARRKQVEGDLLVHVDAAVVVVNKPAGISSVPFGDEPSEEVTLDALVREVLAHRDRIRGRAPLGVVHRLDKGTSGLLVFGRTVAAKQHLGQQLREHSTYRRYLAIAHGAVRSGTVRSHLVENRGDGLRGSAPRGAREGQLAVTHVEALEALAGGATLVGCRLETGRTHQIRIHLAEGGHPIVGEQVYVRNYRGVKLAAPRPMLHAAELGFVHPTSGREMRFQVDPPEDFVKVLERLRQGGG
ncbi:RluA family pseudouridine synthase [Chondromyces apiculatus]|uniref:Ribosomal large subunit pseudouridine synthase D n=1 Tax=Chondromyces apiculatus DSM 436 TaxID=1192034 RepID=A0A017T8K6_9BACT|nr:RluA family pseudouridine synthase [Chondromyces apiculatus]EYF05573.1 Ribosomal large subunit pseudouridine synthase D [Chondromyces apiculatus DSM 436]